MKTIIKPVIRIDIVSDVVCPWCYIDLNNAKQRETNPNQP